MANRFLSNIRINDAYTFPASDGSNGQVIVTDGSGNLAFANPATSSSASIIYRDNFTGDGSTVAFTLQNSLSDEDQTFIYIDGVYQEKGTYSLSTNTITFTTAPDTGHSIEVISVSGINVGPTTIYQDNFTGDGTTTDFTLAQVVDNEVKTMIYFNGVYQFKGTYSLNGTALSFDTAPANGVDIEVISIASAAAADYNQKVLFYGKASEAISKGDAIMLGGQEGDHFLLSKATQAAIAANHEYFLGLASQDLAQGEFGYVTEFGKITELDTSGYTAGDILWFDAGGSTAGALTTTEPAPPLVKIQVAAVIRSHQNEGVLFIRPTWYHELGELHDVNITSIADKDILAWNNTNGYWENTKTLDSLTANTLSATTLTGTLSTAAQTNITSVGTLTSLNVSGIITSNSSSTGDYVRLYGGSGSAQWDIYGNGENLRFSENSGGGGSVVIDSNVGIGTASPDTKLHVTGGHFKLDNGIGDGYIQDSNGNNRFYWGTGTYINSPSTSGLIAMYVGGSERARITNDGYLGINTTSPETLLEVQQSAVGSDGVTFDANTTNRATIQFQVNTDYTRIQTYGRGTSLGNLSLNPLGNNVGIGTTSPGAKLHIVGSGENGGILFNVSGQQEHRFYSSANIQFNTIGSSTPIWHWAQYTGVGVTPNYKMTLNNTGLGIGTTSPLNKLSVVVSDTFGYYDRSDATAVIQDVLPTLLIAHDGNATNEYAELRLGNNQVTYYPYSAYIRGVQGSGIDQYSLEFGVANYGHASTKMTLSKDGNLGIGLTNPRGDLSFVNQVANGTFAPTSYTASSTIAGQNFINNYYTSASYGTYNYPRYMDIVAVGAPDGTAGGSHIRFFTNPRTANASSEVRMDIAYDGSVMFNAGKIYLASSNQVLESSSNNLRIWQRLANNIDFLTYDQTRMRIDANGNIGAPTGTNIYNASDQRVKRNIRPISDSLNTVLGLNPVKFNWIQGFNEYEENKELLGFIAQEMQQVLPEAVEQFAEGNVEVNGETIENTLRVNEKFIIPVLTKAIQEQQAIIEDLKARIETLENN